MKQQYFLNSYLEHEQEKSIKDRLLYLSMAFRPAGTLITCLVLSVAIAIPCYLLMKANSSDSVLYAISFAIFTGIVASGMVSLTIEMVNNYRHNYQRLLVLHEYLLTIARYEDHVQWCLHGRTDNDCPGCFTARNMATSELILDVGPVIEAAYEKGKEYMSLQEMKQAIRVVEAASRIGEIAESFASDNMIDATGANLYECMKEPFKTNLTSFAKDVSISLVSRDVGSIVADYILTFPEELDGLEQHELKRQLSQFDEGMCALKAFVGNDPGYYEELIPWEKRFEKQERKILRQGEQAENEALKTIQKALEEGRVTQGEYEEYLELKDEVVRIRDLDIKSLFDHFGDDDEAMDKAIEEKVKRESEERHKKEMRLLQILGKAEGFQFDPEDYKANNTDDQRGVIE